VYILGICDSQDAGAVILNTSNNKITAVNEERISRIKLSGGFPFNSIKEVLSLSKIKPEDVGLVAVASNMTPSSFLRVSSNFRNKLKKKNKQFSLLLSIYIIYQVIAKCSVLLEYIESKFSSFILQKKLFALGIKAKVHMVEHHHAHAYGAYITSGMNKALIFTIDGLGDGLSFSVNVGENGQIKRIYDGKAITDITLYYSRLTEFLGFEPIQDEGKVMGLAAYSDNYNAMDEARMLLRAHKGKFKSRNIFYFFSKDRGIFKKLRTKSREDIAASFQNHAESIICDIVRYWIKETGVQDVALGGGFFANIKVNQRIAQMNEVSRVYVYPHMGDGGLALGAAYTLKKSKPFELDDVFFGRSYSDEQIEEILGNSGLNYKKVNNIEDRIALLLSQGKVVARFYGAMEYGPRALGNRSILAQATDSNLQESLNKKLGRETFMPFAPAMLDSSSKKCCIGTEKAAYSASFMNISFSCTEYFKKTCPAAVHKDGTTRPQCVSQANNPSFYRVLNAYEKYTGIPAFINTSFNLHEEHIVCSPTEALKVFRKGKLDYLAINNFLIQGDEDEKEKR
jgi:carbamoyltransferase